MLLLLLLAGWTDDLWARSLLESPPAVPLTLDDDAAYPPRVSDLDFRSRLTALRRPSLLTPGDFPYRGPTPFMARLPDTPPLNLRSEDPRLASECFQQ